MMGGGEARAPHNAPRVRARAIARLLLDAQGSASRQLRDAGNPRRGEAGGARSRGICLVVFPEARASGQAGENPSAHSSSCVAARGNGPATVSPTRIRRRTLRAFGFSRKRASHVVRRAPSLQS